MKRDAIIERSAAQQRMRLELARLELKPLGYTIVRSSWLSQMIKRLPPADRVEAMVEAAR